MALAAALGGLLLLVFALVIWQHSTRLSDASTFGVEDAVAFVMSDLPPATARRLGEGGVRRILEWEVYYLQGLAQPNRHESVETVAGPYGPAIEYIGDQIESALGKSYPAEDIRAVLELEVLYLDSIGAIGDQIGGIPS